MSNSRIRGMHPTLSNQFLIFGVTNHVCKSLGVRPEQLRTTSRKREYVEARAVIYKLLHDATKSTPRKLSESEIGKLFGRGHATVLHGLEMIRSIPDLKSKYEAVRESYQRAADIQP